jgi:predicted DNA-binding transcriptional regulator AlpA
MPTPKRLIPDSLVLQRYGISAMTLWRWDRDPDLNFPKPKRIRKRKYRDEEELDAFDAALRNSRADEAAV